MTDRQLLVLRTAALDRVARRNGKIRQLAVEAKQRRGVVDADDILALTDQRSVFTP